LAGSKADPASGLKAKAADSETKQKMAVTGDSTPMTRLDHTLDVVAIAGDVLAALASKRQIPPFSSRPGGLNLADAYRVTPQLRTAFETRGEKIAGRKIGFTNSGMWKAYGVDAPIWGYATDRTTRDIGQAGTVSADDFLEPRIEPEIMFGLKAAPAPGMTGDALLDCIDWLALGYEIVQSIYPGWKFTAADVVAANGVHGCLLVGNRRPVAPREAQWLRELAAFEVALHCNGTASQKGGGALVLGSPLNALSHLVSLLAADPHNPPLRAGEIISTGTLTLAMPVKAGQTWTTKMSGIPLEDISVRFE
jgi:2-oxo-3-hexenedioate decarboxylase